MDDHQATLLDIFTSQGDTVDDEDASDVGSDTRSLNDGNDSDISEQGFEEDDEEEEDDEQEDTEAAGGGSVDCEPTSRIAGDEKAAEPVAGYMACDADIAGEATGQTEKIGRPSVQANEASQRSEEQDAMELDAAEEEGVVRDDDPNDADYVPLQSKRKKGNHQVVEQWEPIRRTTKHDEQDEDPEGPGDIVEQRAWELKPNHYEEIDISGNMVIKESEHGPIATAKPNSQQHVKSKNRYRLKIESLCHELVSLQLPTAQ